MNLPRHGDLYRCPNLVVPGRNGVIPPFCPPCQHRENKQARDASEAQRLVDTYPPFGGIPLWAREREEERARHFFAEDRDRALALGLSVDEHGLVGVNMYVSTRGEVQRTSAGAGGAGAGAEAGSAGAGAGGDGGSAAAPPRCTAGMNRPQCGDQFRCPNQAVPVRYGVTPLFCPTCQYHADIQAREAREEDRARELYPPYGDVPPWAREKEELRAGEIFAEERARARALGLPVHLSATVGAVDWSTVSTRGEGVERTSNRAILPAPVDAVATVSARPSFASALSFGAGGAAGEGGWGSVVGTRERRERGGVTFAGADHSTHPPPASSSSSPSAPFRFGPFWPTAPSALPVALRGDYGANRGWGEDRAGERDTSLTDSIPSFGALGRIAGSLANLARNLTGTEATTPATQEQIDAAVAQAASRERKRQQELGRGGAESESDALGQSDSDIGRTGKRSGGGETSGAEFHSANSDGLTDNERAGDAMLLDPHASPGEMEAIVRQRR